MSSGTAATRGVFVTGTDTGVGKTLVAVALVRAGVATGLRVAGMKPVASGGMRQFDGMCVNEDSIALKSASNVPASYREVNPICFEPPISPHIAAAEMGVTIELDPLRVAARQLAARCDWLVVEGAGGLLAPLSERSTMAELAAALGLPLVIVVGLRLGCLNHARLTLEAAQQRGLPVAGWIASAVDPQMLRPRENLRTLEQQLGGPALGMLDHGVDAAAAAGALGPALRALTAYRAG